MSFLSTNYSYTALTPLDVYLTYLLTLYTYTLLLVYNLASFALRITYRLTTS
jgi:hypothetical protein